MARVESENEGSMAAEGRLPESIVKVGCWSTCLNQACLKAAPKSPMPPNWTKSICLPLLCPVIQIKLQSDQQKVNP